jgi:hypothetical protein
MTRDEVVDLYERLDEAWRERDAGRLAALYRDDAIEERALKVGDRIRLGPTLELTPRDGRSARFVDHVLDLVLDSAIEITGAERGFVILGDSPADLEFKTRRNRDKVTLTV